MGRGTEQIFFQRKHIDDPQAHENVLNFANHQRHASQNHDELSPQTCENGHPQKDHKCWQGCGKRAPLYTVFGM